jgi:hypothetical protein
MSPAERQAARRHRQQTTEERLKAMRNRTLDAFERLVSLYRLTYSRSDPSDIWQKPDVADAWDEVLDAAFADVVAAVPEITPDMLARQLPFADRKMRFHRLDPRQPIPRIWRQPAGKATNPQ